jgi:hypothetical protein
MMLQRVSIINLPTVNTNIKTYSHRKPQDTIEQLAWKKNMPQTLNLTKNRRSAPPKLRKIVTQSRQIQNEGETTQTTQNA